MARWCAVLLLAASLLVPFRCETRKHFHSRYSSSISSGLSRSGSTGSFGSTTSRSGSDAAYVKTIPLRLLNCLQHVSLLDCGKLYLLQNMEARSYRFTDTDNLTHDVQDVLLPSYRNADNKLFSDQLLALNGSDVNGRLARGLRLLFNERLIDLQLMPGVAVRLTPSDSNQLEFSVRKDITALEPEVAGRDKAKKGIRTVLQLAVPLILLPSMLLAGVLPMVLPVLKFASIFSSIVNHAALAAAIMYLAKQHAAEQESKQTVYFNAGYN